MLRKHIVINSELLKSLGFKLIREHNSFNYYVKPPNFYLYLYDDCVCVYYKTSPRIFSLTYIDDFIDYIKKHDK